MGRPSVTRTPFLFVPMEPEPVNRLQEDQAMRCVCCRRELELAHVWVGSKTICPHCHAVMRVPPPAAARPAGDKPAAAIVRLLILLLFLAGCGILVWTWLS